MLDLCEPADQRLLEQAHIRDDVLDSDDRIADQLARAVVGDLAAAIGLDDLDPALRVPGLAHAELARCRAAAACVDGWVVLQQQQRVGNQLPLAGVAHLLLQRERVAVTDLTQLTDPQLSHCSDARALRSDGPKGNSPPAVPLAHLVGEIRAGGRIWPVKPASRAVVQPQTEA